MYYDLIIINPLVFCIDTFSNNKTFFLSCPHLIPLKIKAKRFSLKGSSVFIIPLIWFFKEKNKKRIRNEVYIKDKVFTEIKIKHKKYNRNKTVCLLKI